MRLSRDNFVLINEIFVQFELKDMKRRQDEDIMRMDIIEKQKEQEKSK